VHSKSTLIVMCAD